MSTATQTRAVSLVTAAEDLLSARAPAHCDVWPTGKSDGVPGSEIALAVIKHGSGFDATTLSPRTEEQPDQERQAALDAIEEVLRFAWLLLRDDNRGGATEFRFASAYFQDEVRAACRRHLVRILAHWYELEEREAVKG